MATQKRTFFDDEFKKEAVRLASDPNRLTKDVATELGVHPFSISRWKKELRDGKKTKNKARKGSGEPEGIRSASRRRVFVR